MRVSVRRWYPTGPQSKPDPNKPYAQQVRYWGRKQERADSQTLIPARLWADYRNANLELDRLRAARLAGQ